MTNYDTNRIYVDQYSIELYVGEKRSGKTLSMVAETYELLKENPEIPVYSNMKLNKKFFPTFTFITKEDLEIFYEKKKEFQNAIFLIDEIQIFMDSRNFQTKKSKKIGYFLGQMGKRGNIFRGTTHFPHLVDFRLRQYCEKWNYIRKGLMEDGKWIPIINNNRVLTKAENDRLYIQIKPIIRKMINFSFAYINDNTKYIKAASFFNHYKTEELIY